MCLHTHNNRSYYKKFRPFMATDKISPIQYPSCSAWWFRHTFSHFFSIFFFLVEGYHHIFFSFGFHNRWPGANKLCFFARCSCPSTSISRGRYLRLAWKVENAYSLQLCQYQHTNQMLCILLVLCSLLEAVGYLFNSQCIEIFRLKWRIFRLHFDQKMFGFR